MELTEIPLLRSNYIQSEDNILSLDSVRHYIFPYNLTAAPATVEEERPLFQTPPEKPRILLTGGASCPDGIIQQVIHRINSFFPPENIRSIEAILGDFE